MTVRDQAGLNDYLAVLRRRWLVLSGGVLLGLALGIVTLQLSSVSYSSTTSVIVGPIETDANLENSRTNSAINLDTEAQIVVSSVVATLAAKELDSTESPRELAKQVSVGVPANTSVLNITFAAASAQQAFRGSQAFANAYLENRTSVAERRITGLVAGLQDRIDGLNSQLARVTRQLAALPPDADRSLLTTARDLLVEQIRSSTQELEPLTLQAIEPGDVITEAQLPSRPSGLPPAVVIASGLFLGLLLGLCAAYARDRRDRRIREPHDLAPLGMGVLVPRFTLPGAEELFHVRPRSTEAMRQLRNTLLAATPNHRGTLTVASVTADSAGAVTATHLATTLARSGVETILVSANTYRDVIGELHHLGDAPGLAAVLSSRRSLLDCVHAVAGIPKLAVVPAGADGALYSELLQDSALGSILSQLEELADIVVLDVAPTSVNADAQTVVTVTNGILLVTVTGVSTTDEVVDAMTQMKHVNAPLLGSVLVEPVDRHRRRDRRREQPRRRAGGAPMTGLGADPWDAPDDTEFTGAKIA